MSDTATPTHLPDLRFDAVDLIGRPGAHRDISRTVTVDAPDGAPAALWIPAGTELALEGSLESVVEGIYAGGNASTHVAGECSRCLDPIEQDLDVRFDELFTYPEKVPHDMSEEDREEVVLLEGDAVDLGPLVYDALVLAIPSRPLCRPDCPGLCAQCGARLEDDPDHHHDVIDDRFAALAGFFEEPGTEDQEVPGSDPRGASGSDR